MLVYCRSCNKLYNCGIVQESKYFLTHFNLDENKSSTTLLYNNVRIWHCYNNLKHEVQLIEYKHTKKSFKLLNSLFIQQKEADVMYIDLTSLTSTQLIQINNIINKEVSK